VAEIPQGYREIPEEDRKKAQVFFERGQAVANTGNYEYAIEMYLQGLSLDPDAVDAHQSLRDISLKRKASGGKDLGMFEKMRLKRSGKDDKLNMLNCEKLLAYDPGNTDHMVCILQNAHREGYYDTVLWIGPILQRANADTKSPDFNKFMILKDIYKDLRQYKLATDACQQAVNMRPDDMDLTTELKNLGAQHTMDQGRYGTAGSFRHSIRDADRQARLLEADRDVRTVDSLERAIREAEADWQADPEEPGKVMKLVEALVRTEQPEHEQRAIELLEQTYERTKQFRFRHAAGRIRLSQLVRRERALRAKVQANLENEELRQEYAAFARERAQQELEEYKLWSEHYPTDMGFKYQIAHRLFLLNQYNDAIPALQQARTDPKFRVDAGILLGRAFLEDDFTDEAVDTLKDVIDEYQIRGDNKSKDMWYWYGRALEKKGDAPAALKCFSQVAQWDFNYRDVQARVKRLRPSA
jgi:tetratricopeptide (TPR) repeat protein